MTSVTDAIKVIEDAVPDPKKGLGQEVFFMVSRLTPMINVDLLIRNDQRDLLLTWREDQFYGPGWHIPGGVLRFKETYAERITAVALSELGATVESEDQPAMICPAMNHTRNTRGHFISLGFNCILTSTLDNSFKYSGNVPRHGEWAWHQEKPHNLIPVHVFQYGSIF